jgi:hypothetical protein
VNLRLLNNPRSLKLQYEKYLGLFEMWRQMGLKLPGMLGELDHVTLETLKIAGEKLYLEILSSS